MRVTRRFVGMLVLMIVVATITTSVSALAQGPCPKVEGKPNPPSFCSEPEGNFKQGFPIKWQG